ncbi:uncharacterized protein LOC144746976 [Ciona intestinalis]
MTYPENSSFEPRTDCSFRNRTNVQHHHSDSPFCDLPIDMISQFPIDYMHQVCLGVTKKLITSWMRGAKKIRLSSIQLSNISERLINTKACIPACFARKPRPLTEIDRWKATEFRQFLLYTGKVVLLKILPAHLYHHFMLLSVAICILVSPHLAKHHMLLANRLLVRFVADCSEIYGPEFLVYNIHSLVHLPFIAQNYSCLDNCSSFVFESFMHKLKKMVRSGKCPLTQVVNRLTEHNDLSLNINPSCGSISSKYPNNFYVLNIGKPNCVCVEVLNIFSNDSKTTRMCLCRIFDKLNSFFELPCSSRIIGVYTSKVLEFRTNVIDIGFSPTAAICLKNQNKAVFISILHEINC